MIPIIILSLVVLVITGLSLYFIFAKMKSTAGKVILTIVVLIAALAIEIVGVSIIGFVALGNVFKDEVKKSQDKAKETLPMNASGEIKSIFEQSEIVKGNDLEVQILKTYKFMDGTSNQYYPKKEYCAVDVRVKNIGPEKTAFGSLETDFMKDDGTVVYATSVFMDDANDKYQTKRYEVEPQKEVTFPVAAPCEEQASQFVLKDYKIRLDNQGPRDIKIKVAF